VVLTPFEDLTRAQEDALRADALELVRYLAAPSTRSS
jgi:hypothetical protein